jgi:hypothetical protein
MKASFRLFRFGVPLGLAVSLIGCFYPPVRPRDSAQSSIDVDEPFDLVWDAAHNVIAANGFRVITEDPDSGLIESQSSGGFTLKDADCGQLRSIANKYAAEPNIDATVVYNFYVKPAGGEATTVSVQATFDAPLEIPLHPMTNVQCVSRGVEERRLLKQIAAKAAMERRPSFDHRQ